MNQIQELSCGRRHTRRVFHHLAAGVKAEYFRKKAEIRYSIFSNAVLVAGMIAILGYGGFQVIKGALSIGALVAFYSYLVRLFEPLYMALEMGSRFQRIGAGIRRFDAIFQIKPSVANAPDAEPLPAAARGHVKVRGAKFAFQTGPVAIRDVDLEVKPGQRVALVGPNGAGKSTLAKLLARVYDAQAGSIAIDGRDIRKLRLDSLRSHVAYMPQESLLFDCTLAENLLMARPSATGEELAKVMEMTRLSAKMDDSQRGWRTPVGPGGNRLSAGERQRVALARILLRKPTILVLDEATAAMDPSTERFVLERLDSVLPDTTLIVITHRLSAITWFDNIVVLNNGQVVEAGRHTDLYCRRGLYAELYDHQAVSDRRTKAVSSGVAGTVF
jgi:subfamily B ATP-binding cassette protein MsbA